MKTLAISTLLVAVYMLIFTLLSSNVHASPYLSKHAEEKHYQRMVETTKRLLRPGQTYTCSRYVCIIEERASVSNQKFMRTYK